MHYGYWSTFYDERIYLIGVGTLETNHWAHKLLSKYHIAGYYPLQNPSLI